MGSEEAMSRILCIPSHMVELLDERARLNLWARDVHAILTGVRKAAAEKGAPTGILDLLLSSLPLDDDGRDHG
jgi:hypothetical protein